MYRTIKNNKTGVIHAADSTLRTDGTPISLCNCVDLYYKNFDAKNFDVRRYTNKSMKDSMVTCKNCLRLLGLLPKQASKGPDMPVYEFGKRGGADEVVWIKTNREIRLTAAAKRKDKYIRKIDVRGSAPGIDLVIT